jgi:hypothetical protein
MNIQNGDLFVYSFVHSFTVSRGDVVWTQRGDRALRVELIVGYNNNTGSVHVIP